MSDFDLKKLADPFPACDIEWRASRSWPQGGKIICKVLAYITARAIANRLDAVCGPENWSNTQQQIKELRPGQFSIQVGISIRVGDDWVTKYDVSEPTNIEPAKGGFSGAMKRAGSQWGIGRYLWMLDEEDAETSTKDARGWYSGKLSDKHGGDYFYWKPPQLPAWALPNDPDAGDKPVTDPEINALKRKWAETFAKNERGKQALSTGFAQFVHSIVGEIPVDVSTCWTQNMVKQVHARIVNTRDPKGPSSDVPFT